MQPAPASFSPVGGIGGSGDIIGFDDGPPPVFFDDSLFDFTIGQTIQAESAQAQNLYRVRLDQTGTALLGGSGGLPGNGQGIFFFSPGAFGTQGPSGVISGLPVQ